MMLLPFKSFGFSFTAEGFLARSLALACFTSIVGCLSTAPATPKTTTPAATYPTRPTTQAPPFKLFHQTKDTLTLTTTTTASNADITALIYQLRDAAHAHTCNALDKSGTIQKAVDARHPIIWFHIYRGPKCAAEKYAPGPPPCGPSYHAAGDYTFGDYTNPTWDDGKLIAPDGQETPLWNPNAPYSN